MPHKHKATADEKIRVVRECLAGRMGQSEVRECHQEKGYPVAKLCRLLHIAKSAYYKWEAGKKGNRIRENEDIADKVEKNHEKSPDKGYRRINDDL